MTDAFTAAMLLLSPLLDVPLTVDGFLLGTLTYTLAGMVFAGIGLLLATSITGIQTLQSSVALAMFRCCSSPVRCSAPRTSRAGWRD